MFLMKPAYWHLMEIANQDTHCYCTHEEALLIIIMIIIIIIIIISHGNTPDGNME